MPAMETITNMSSTLHRKWQLDKGKLTLTLKYRILISKIMEAANSIEGERLLFGPAISSWERGERERKGRKK